MFQILIVAAGAISMLEEILANVTVSVPGKEYRHSTASSRVVFTAEEQEAWASDTLSVEDRVALVRRGLIRQATVDAA